MNNPKPNDGRGPFRRRRFCETRYRAVFSPQIPQKERTVPLPTGPLTLRSLFVFSPSDEEEEHAFPLGADHVPFAANNE